MKKLRRLDIGDCENIDLSVILHLSSLKDFNVKKLPKKFNISYDLYSSGISSNFRNEISEIRRVLTREHRIKIIESL